MALATLSYAERGAPKVFFFLSLDRSLERLVSSIALSNA
jgi:hypothetical protein